MRLDRLECEISSSDYIPLYITLELLLVFDIVRVNYYTTLVFGPILEARKFPALRVRDIVVRAIFRG